MKIDVRHILTILHVNRPKDTLKKKKEIHRLFTLYFILYKYHYSLFTTTVKYV